MVEWQWVRPIESIQIESSMFQVSITNLNQPNHFQFHKQYSCNSCEAMLFNNQFKHKFETDITAKKKNR